MLITCPIILLDKKETCNSEQAHMYYKYLTQAGKLEVWADETEKVKLHIGIFGPISKLETREISDLRGNDILILFFRICKSRSSIS